MASYSVDKAKHATLVASTVDTITFTSDSPGPLCKVSNWSASAVIYCRIDGTDPTVAGDNTYRIGSGSFITLLPRGNAVKVISSGTPDYSVELYD